MFLSQFFFFLFFVNDEACSPGGVGECKCSIGLERTVWKSDDGYLKGRDTLPVMKVVSDHPNENLTIDIGSLYCR